jgi:hypothetical protein
MFCRNCGKELIGIPELCPSCGARPMNATSFCPGCSAPTTPLTEICPKCGARVGKLASTKTWRPIAAGVLTIISGAMGVIGALGFLSLPMYPDDISYGATLFIVSMVVIMGGVVALGRRTWGLALAGAILALWPGMIILAIPAIVFTALSRAEFK